MEHIHRVTKPRGAILTESWNVWAMKMTLDLPSNLVREMKLRAAHGGRKLRDVATDIFRRGLSQPTPPGEAVRHRVKLPLIACRASSIPAMELIGIVQW